MVADDDFETTFFIDLKNLQCDFDEYSGNEPVRKNSMHNSESMGNVVNDNGEQSSGTKLALVEVD
jgi:hypothetical protein